MVEFEYKRYLGHRKVYIHNDCAGYQFIFKAYYRGRAHMNMCNLWYKTEDELKDQQNCGINLFRDPQTCTVLLCFTRGYLFWQNGKTVKVHTDTPLDDPRRFDTERIVNSMASCIELKGSAIPVHVDKKARDLTRSHSADGLMISGNIYLNPDTYKPDRATGKEILAHELIHLAQYRKGSGVKKNPPFVQHLSAEQQPTVAPYVSPQPQLQPRFMPMGETFLRRKEDLF